MRHGNDDRSAGTASRGEKVLRAVAVAATVLFVALRLGAAAQLPHGLVFVFMAGYVVLLPGWLLAERLLPGARGLWRFAAGFLLGTALSFLLLFAVALAGLDISLVGWGAAVVVAFLSRAPAVRRGERAFPALRLVDLALLLLAVIVAAGFALRDGDPFSYTSDSADHAGWIRAVARTGEAFPDAACYPDGGMDARDIRKGMGHALWGALNRLAGREDILPVWPLVLLIANALLLVSAFCGAALLTGRSSVGALAAILSLLFLGGGLAGGATVTNAYGYPLGRGPYLLFVAGLFRWAHRGEAGHLLLAAAALLVAAWTHVAHGVAAAFIFLVLSGIELTRTHPAGRGRLLRRLGLLAGIAAATNLPYLLMRLVRDYAPANPIHTVTQGFLLLGDRLAVINPMTLFGASGGLGLLALAGSFILWRRSRKNDALRLLVTGTILFYLLVFCPVLFPVLFRRLSYLLIRLHFAAPPVFLCAVLLRECWKRIRGRNPLLGAPAAAVGLLLAAVFLLPHLARTPGAFRARGDRAGFRRLESLWERIRLLPPGSAVAADPVTSFGIPAFTGQFAVCPFDQHATPNDATAPARIAAMRSIFAPEGGAAAAESAMRRYGATHIAINGELPPRIETLFWKPSAAAARRTAAVLDDSACFERLWSAGDLWLFKLAESCETGDGAEPAALPPAPRAGGAPSGVPGIRILSLALPGEAARGDTVGVSIAWTADEPPSHGGWVAYLRFDAPFPRGFLYREWYGKIYRKIVERIEGRRYRFRVQRQPRDGLFPPDAWPSGRIVRDRIVFRVPADVAPGSYAVSLRLAEKRQYFNYRPGDLLRNDDRFGGAVLDSLLIR